MAKLTKKSVDALTPRDKLYTCFDDDIKGFGCRVMPTGVKTFCLEFRPAGSNRNSPKKRLTLGRYGAMTVEQARRSALTALSQIRLGSDPQAEKADQRAAVTVSGLVEAFTGGHIEIKLKAKTRGPYKAALDRLGAAYGSMKAEALTRSHVARLHAEMVGSPFAANRFLATVSKMFAFAEERGLVPERHANPAAKIQHYREYRRERFLSTEELARLGDALSASQADPFAVAAIRLLILTGARLQEIVTARWEQVDLDRGVIFLDDSKTGAKPVYLSAAVLEVLASLPRVSGNPYIIAGAKDGAPRADLKRPWAAVTKAAELDGVRLHDLRHSFASIGAGASMGLPVLGKLLGHSQAATTHRYAHLDADPLRRAADTIGATIDAAMRRKTPGQVVPLRAVQKQ
jgi:integrase